ncbi:VRR-NUC domain-containing protein [Salmonella enterica]|nr:VRR-NUC domain-containing protein [Salmonella enterica]
MNQRESVEQRNIWGAIGLLCSLFRVNTGRAYVSGMGPAGVSKLSDNSILMKAARPIGMGFTDPRGQLVTGVSDLNGWTSIVITPAMIGQTIAVYTSVETKRTQGGRTSIDQERWISKVQKAGGIAFVANCAQSAKAQVTEWLQMRGAKSVDHTCRDN